MSQNDRPMAAFYTELPQADGSRHYTNSQARVIKAIVEEGGDGEQLRVLSPDREEFPWRIFILPSALIEVEGPPRKLTEHEYVEVIEKAGADKRLVDIARRAANSREPHTTE